MELGSAQFIQDSWNLWITDPPYTDAVNYEELYEFFSGMVRA